MTDWLTELAALKDSGEAAVLVTIAGVRGSAPRDVGAKMLVTRADSRGTIGGGELEYQCIRIAADRLRTSDTTGRVRRFPLGSNCGQCCGGVVDVLFEPLAGIACRDDLLRAWSCRDDVVMLTVLDSAGRPRKALLDQHGTVHGDAQPDKRELQLAAAALEDRQAAMRVDMPGRHESFLLLEPVMDARFNIAVFGAGHVGSAIVQLLAGLDCSVRWIDGRRDIFPDAVSGNVQCIATADPVREVAALPAGAYCLVLTHSHALDLDIVAATLRRDEVAFCGLIGSMTKRRRFEQRLRQQGLNDAQLRRMTCPIGIGGINGKAPQEIAIATAADLLRRRENQLANRHRPAATIRALNSKQ